MGWVKTLIGIFLLLWGLSFALGPLLEDRPGEDARAPVIRIELGGVVVCLER